jgi:hypothetical protein
MYLIFCILYLICAGLLAGSSYVLNRSFTTETACFRLSIRLKAPVKMPVGFK